MFVHVKYRNERGIRVMEFSSNSFNTVNDVTEKVRLVYGKLCILQLYNEHGRGFPGNIRECSSVYGKEASKMIK